VSRLASVYPIVSARSLARPFTYEIGDEVGKGAVLAIRFGNARRRGVVVDADAEAPPDVEPVAAERVLETLPPALVDLALWLADYYGSTPARALALIAPQQRTRRGERREVAVTAALPAEPAPVRLSESQERALERIEQLLAGGGGNVLLAGATGSGKTEVYIRACEAAVAAGRGAIVLVPEIALTPQTLGRFRARFGDRVALLHSGLSDAERRDERERIVAGEASVVVGARSAVFAPLPSLGVVCVDEEHDSSYKQDSDPRYDARTVAAKRAALEGAVAIFAAARVLASARAARARRPDRGAAAHGPRRRPAPGDRLSALRPAPRRARPAGGRRRKGDPPAQPARRRPGPPLPRLRSHAPLPELRRRLHAPWRRDASLPPLRRP
jgi:primosomal protein N' (replication factor Y)